MDPWGMDIKKKFDKLGYELWKERDTPEHATFIVSPGVEKGKTDIVIHCYFTVIGMMDVRITEEDNLKKTDLTKDIPLEERWTHSEEAKTLVFEFIELYADHHNIQVFITQDHPFTSAVATCSGFTHKHTQVPFVVSRLTGYNETILVKVRSVEKWNFLLSFKEKLIQALSQMEKKYAEFEYNLRGQTCAFYYAGKIQSLGWRLEKGQYLLVDVEKSEEVNYPVTDVATLNETLEQLIHEVEKSMRIKNVLTPPKRYFNEYLLAVAEETKDVIYQLLLQKMNARDIEKCAAIMYKNETKKHIIYNDALISFGQYVIVLGNNTKPMCYESVLLFDTKETLMQYLMENEKKKLKEIVDQVFIN